MILGKLDAVVSPVSLYTWVGNRCPHLKGLMYYSGWSVMSPSSLPAWHKTHTPLLLGQSQIEPRGQKRAFGNARQKWDKTGGFFLFFLKQITRSMLWNNSPGKWLPPPNFFFKEPGERQLHGWVPRNWGWNKKSPLWPWMDMLSEPLLRDYLRSSLYTALRGLILE